MGSKSLLLILVVIAIVLIVASVKFKSERATKAVNFLRKIAFGYVIAIILLAVLAEFELFSF
jgi:Ca2+/Na+ antiporter|tara:strand:+ start:553 stop:738 length:186 start_codon:yes stop_codon:yes gene_type:complete